MTIAYYSDFSREPASGAAKEVLEEIQPPGLGD